MQRRLADDAQQYPRGPPRPELPHANFAWNPADRCDKIKTRHVARSNSTAEVTMSATRDEVLKSAMELSETGRLVLAAELMETVSDDLPGWSIEAADLSAELESRTRDGSQGISWEKVRERLRADLNP